MLSKFYFEINLNSLNKNSLSKTLNSYVNKKSLEMKQNKHVNNIMSRKCDNRSEKIIKN